MGTLSSLDEQFGITSLVVFVLIVIANIITLVLNANRLQDKAMLNTGSFDDERKNFNVVNSIIIVGIPFLLFLFYMAKFKYSGGKLHTKKYGFLTIMPESKTGYLLKEFTYKSFWIPLTMAITFLIFSNFINSLRNVKSNETEEDENVSLAGIVVSFVSISVFIFMVTYIVTN